MKFDEKIESEGKAFVKLKDGETIRGVLRGNPFSFRQHWTDNRSLLCPGNEVCDLCKQGKKSSFRFRLNFVVKEGETYSPKIFEQGYTVYDYLRDLNEEYDLENTPVKITRKGEGKNTSYVILPEPKPLTKEAAAAIAKVELLELAPGARGAEEPGASDDDVPF